MIERIEILDDAGNIINVIAATRDFAELVYPGHWRGTGIPAEPLQPDPPAPPAP